MKNKLSLSLLSLLALAGLSACAFQPIEPSPKPSGDDKNHSDDDKDDDKKEEKFAGYAPEGYILSWADEFDQSTLSDNWEPMIGDGSNYGVYRWGNNEQQYYTSDNVYVENDALHIQAIREDAVSDKDETYHFTSGRIRSKGKITTTYGYIEARMILPEGTGLWPAFWMLPESRFAEKGWPTSGEIDIMEARGRINNVIGATIHSANINGNDAYIGKDFTFKEGEDYTDYHCYAVEWNETSFNFSVDGEVFHTVTNTSYQHGIKTYTDVSASAPFDRPFHLLFNLAIGGNYDGGKNVDSSFKEAEMLVDYVRIFHKE